MFVLPSAQNFNFTDVGLLPNGVNVPEERTVAIYTNAVQRLTVDSDGNVGIGVTVTPFSHKLDINGTLNVQDTANFTDINVTGNMMIENLTATGTTNLDNLTVLTNATIQGGTIYLTDNNEYISSDGNNVLIGVNGSERLRINNTGQVGIGTNNPLTSLHISGNLRTENFSTGDAYLQIASGRGNVWEMRAGTSVDGSNPLRIRNIGSDDYITILEQNGNVGIGVTLPQEKLDVAGNINVSGNVIVHGDTFTVNSTSISIDDPMIRLADNNSANITDIGFYGMYVDTGVTKFTGIFKDASESKWHLFDGDLTEPGENTHITNNAFLTVDTGVSGGSVGINTQNPLVSLDIHGTDAILIPKGTTAQRPTATDGLLRYNTEQTTFEGYSNGNWGPIGGGAADLDGDTYIQAETSVGADEDELQFFTNGTERMKIDSSGNVGIGTNTPSAKGSTTLQLYGASNTSYIHLTTNTTGTTADDGSFIGHSGDNLIIYNQENSALRLGTNDTERMRIDSAGLVGIGTNAPVTPLHLYENTANVDTTAGLTIENDGTGDAILQFLLTNAKRWVVGIDNSDGDKFKIGNQIDLSSSSFLTIDDSGYVGIGTTNPSHPLHIYNASSGLVANFVTNDTGAAAFFNLQSNRTNNGNLTKIASNSDSATISEITTYLSDVTNDYGEIRFFTRGSGGLNNQMTISEDGLVGIGTTNPSSKLDIRGDLFMFNNNTKTEIYTFQRSVANTEYTEICEFSTQTFMIHLDIVSDGSSNGSTRSYTIPMSWAVISNTWNVVNPTYMSSQGNDIAVDYELQYFNNNGSTHRLRINRNNGGSTNQSVDFSISMRIIADGNSATVTELTGTGTDTTSYSVYPGSSLIHRYDKSENISGRVGIGTTDPVRLFHIWTDDPEATMRVESTEDNANFELSSKSGGGSTSNSDVRFRYLSLGTNVACCGYDGTHGGYAINMGNSGFDTSPNFFIADGGNVGVGTTNPSSLFSVYENADSGTGMVVENTHNGSTVLPHLRVQADNASLRIGAVGSGNTNGNEIIQPNEATIYTLTGTDALAIGSHNAAPIRLITSNTERMVIESGGDVDISNDLVVDGKLSINSASGETNHGLYIMSTTATIGDNTGDYIQIINNQGIGGIACTVYVEHTAGSDSNSNWIFQLTLGRNMGSAYYYVRPISAEYTAGGSDRFELYARQSHGSTYLQLVRVATGTTSAAMKITVISNKNFTISNTTGTGATATAGALPSSRISQNVNNNGEIQLNGSVGIGTDNPDNQLHLYTESGDSNIFVENTNTSSGNAYAYLRTGGSSAGDPYIGFDIYNEHGWSIGIDNSESQNFVFTNSSGGPSNGTKRMVISTSGSVGIGTTNPPRLLTVAGGDDSYIRLQRTNGGNHDWDIGAIDGGSLVFKGGSDAGSAVGSLTEFMRITATGDVGIGDNTPSYKLDVDGDINCTGTLRQNGSAIGSAPTGGIMIWSTGSAPSGWLLCNGASVSTSTYSALFAVIGYTYGGSGGSFNLPNLSGRVPLGSGNSGNTFANSKTLASQGGDEAINQVPSHSHSVQITSANANAAHSHEIQANTNNANASHSHEVQLSTNNTGGHSHNMAYRNAEKGNNGNNVSDFGGNDSNKSTGNAGSHSHNVQGDTKNANATHSHAIQTDTNNANATHSHAVQGQTGNAGNSSVEILPSYLVLNYIIKT